MPNDQAAVKAARRICPTPAGVGGGYINFHAKRRDIARIITDAYKPRLTAEQKVREKLIEACREIKREFDCDFVMDNGEIVGNPDVMLINNYKTVQAALVEVEKLEKQDG